MLRLSRVAFSLQVTVWEEEEGFCGLFFNSKHRTVRESSSWVVF